MSQIRLNESWKGFQAKDLLYGWIFDGVNKFAMCVNLELNGNPATFVHVMRRSKEIYIFDSCP